MAKKISASDITVDHDPRDITGETISCVNKRAIHTRALRGPLFPSGSQALSYIMAHLLDGITWNKYEAVTSDLSDNEQLNFYNGEDLVKAFRTECGQNASGDSTVSIEEIFFLKTESGEYILQENGDRIILDVSNPVIEVNPYSVGDTAILEELDILNRNTVTMICESKRTNYLLEKIALSLQEISELDLEID